MTWGSIWRSEPAPLLRGLAYSGSPASSRSALMRANSALGMYTSPRTSSVSGSAQALRDGRDGAQVGGDVLAGGAVAAGGALDESAALVAQGDGEAIDLELGDVARWLLVRAQQPRTRASNARSSASSKALPRLSMGAWWVTSRERAHSVAPPTGAVGESGVASSGWAASRSWSSRKSAVPLGIRHDRRVQLVVGAVGLAR